MLILERNFPDKRRHFWRRVFYIEHRSPDKWLSWNLSLINSISVREELKTYNTQSHSTLYVSFRQLKYDKYAGGTSCRSQRTSSGISVHIQSCLQLLYGCYQIRTGIFGEIAKDHSIVSLGMSVIADCAFDW